MVLLRVWDDNDDVEGPPNFGFGNVSGYSVSYGFANDTTTILASGEIGDSCASGNTNVYMHRIETHG